jgi:PAS domain S-box-containing protein
MWAVVLTIALAALDIAIEASALLVPLLVAGPLLTARRAGAGMTAAVGALASVLAIVAVAADHTGVSARGAGVVVAVVVGSVLAVLLARQREREHKMAIEAEREREHAALLARVSELFERRGDVVDELRELASLAVPGMAELCTVDLLEADGSIRTVAVHARRPDDAEALTRLRAETPLDLNHSHPVVQAMLTGEPVLDSVISEQDLSRYALSPEHLEFMRATGYRSAVVVPLTARGRRLGALSLLHLGDGRVYDDRDFALVREFARRAGLAIDHARLFGELADTEEELQTILEVMTDAVTVVDADRHVVYANRAAAELLGAQNENDVVNTAGPGLAGVWDLRDERGDEVPIERMPWRRALAGERPEPMVLRATHRESGRVHFWLAKATPVSDRSGRPRLAVSVLEDVTRAKRTELEQRFLAQTSKLLASSLDHEVTLDKIAWAAVPELADWCAVDMPDASGALRRVATADVDRNRLHRPALVVGVVGGSDAPYGPGKVLRTGRAELYEDIGDELLRRLARDGAQLAQLRTAAPLSGLVVPMVAGDRTIGTITLGTTSDSGRRLGPADVAVVEELGRRAGIALENARVHGERSTIASTLQDALLPPRLPVVPGLSIAARFRAAGEASRVGGDFYDLFEVDGAWMVLVGDVTGKGPAAAAITSLARYTMRTAARYERSPAQVLQRLNEALTGERDREALCSAVCARVEPDGGTVRLVVACAGHPLPLLLREDGTIAAAGRPGSLLGAFEDGEWRDHAVELQCGESVVLYTDGVTDTRGCDERFGDARLAEVLAGEAASPADAIAAAIDEALLAFQVGEQGDDVALLVMQAVGGVEQGADTALVGEAS